MFLTLVLRRLKGIITLLRVLFYKCPCLNFPLKVSIKRPGLSQVLRASALENQGNQDFYLLNSFSNIAMFPIPLHLSKCK